jgi:hypothetical protein
VSALFDEKSLFPGGQNQFISNEKWQIMLHWKNMHSRGKFSPNIARKK